MSQDPFQKAKERWQDATDASSEQRRRMLEDLKFSNPAEPKQWDDAIRDARENAPGGSRPCFTFDQTNQYIAQVVNDSRMNKPQINAIPSGGDSHAKVAEAISGMIRHIEYASKASIAYDTAQEHAARIGMGWMRIVPKVVDTEYNLQEICIDSVEDPLSVKMDPNSVKPDGSDQSHGFIESTMAKAAFEKKYKGKQAVSFDRDDSAWFGDDSVRICEYFDQEESKENRLSVVGPDGSNMSLTEDEYWKLVKQIGFKPEVKHQWTAVRRTVKWTKMSGAEILEDPTTFPSKYIPLIPVMGYVLWIEGKRYVCGMVRRMMDSQRAYNMERSAYIEMMALAPKAPYLVDFESVEEFEERWQQANTSNAAFLPYNSMSADGSRALQKPERTSPPNVGSAFAQNAQMAHNDIQASIGMFGASLGSSSEAISGVAQKHRERQGDAANFHYTDNLARSMEHMGRIVVDMLPVLYGDQEYGDRTARMMGLDGVSDAVRIDPNQAESFKMKGKKLDSINLSTGTYDVRVKVGPAFASLREEAAQQLTQIVGQSPQLMTILGPMWARMQDWPEADKVSKLLLAMAPPQVQEIESSDDEIPPAAMMKIQQLQQQLQQAQQQNQHISGALENAAQQHQDLQNQVKAKQDTVQFTTQAAERIQHVKTMGMLELEQQKAQSESQALADKSQREQVAEHDRSQRETQAELLKANRMHDAEMAKAERMQEYEQVKYGVQQSIAASADETKKEIAALAAAVQMWMLKMQPPPAVQSAAEKG